ncbi:TetR family transcriptional regulator [Actinomycetospora sp. TBRC 11914]|uniref:TetR/AcrR family transcriptional regulator n=1 Tax=Actinomycetospora sp. TBRC 11914 TaxID=2729387 RepID=UPI00145E69FF|nr:TetR family transcriptional regulator [Actinomycetospora sp. TBRC 11914]NMO91555.1 helix-turn-helix transcriptional regulator [Actinomycetospora sp. TBRC 11914]
MAFTTRSRAAREAVLAAARRAFAAHGYERTTVRAVAADAGVDPSMVIRYYGSKDDLFRAATAVDLALPDLSQVPQAERGTALARRFVALWDDPETGEVLTVLLRSASTSSEAAARVRETFADQVLVMVRHLADAEDPGVEARAAALGSFMLGTALARYVLELPPLATAPAAEVVATMAPVVDAILAS